MGKWSKFKSIYVKAKEANNLKNTARNIKQNGIIQTTKDYFKRKAYRHTFKLLKAGAQTALKWLFTTPAGWITLGIGIIVASMVGSSMTNQNQEDKALTTNTPDTEQAVTTKQYAAIQTGCPAGVLSNSVVSGSLDLEQGKNKFSLEEVTKFASASIRSTWKIDEDKAASYFLNKNTAVATRYGLKPSNINNVTDAVKAEGVSPVFFYLYAVNEGGGEGGYINHYVQSDMTGDAVKDAKMDAKYIKEMANSVGGKPATGGGEPANLPTEPAQKLLDKLKQGSIGRIYIQATSAVTAEIADLSGQHGEWTGLFGHPISQIMGSVQSLGGDISAGDEISTVNLTNANIEKCNPGKATNAHLKSGGMSLKEAQEWMLDNYVNKNISPSDILPALPGKYETKTNCVAFTWYFIKNFTNLKPGNGNGKDCAPTLASANNLKISHTPSAYSVFSIGAGGAKSLWRWVGEYGHTGVVLGVDKDKGVAVIGQAMYELPYTKIDTVNSGVNVIEIPLDKMTEEQGWSFVNVNDHMKDLKK